MPHSGPLRRLSSRAPGSAPRALTSRRPAPCPSRAAPCPSRGSRPAKTSPFSRSWRVTASSKHQVAKIGLACAGMPVKQLSSPRDVPAGGARPRSCQGMPGKRLFCPWRAGVRASRRRTVSPIFVGSALLHELDRHAPPILSAPRARWSRPSRVGRGLSSRVGRAVALSAVWLATMAGLRETRAAGALRSVVGWGRGAGAVGVAGRARGAFSASPRAVVACARRGGHGSAEGSSPYLWEKVLESRAGMGSMVLKRGS
jgi:hypothetical protein